MKTLLSLGCALLALTSARAQIFGPAALNGAILGGVLGAVVGHNSGSLSHNGWQGAAIGAGVGALFGAAADANAGYSGYYNHAPAAYGGYVYRDGYRGSYASDGLWLGALAGGIVGHNHGGDWRHNGWRGAAWGAGAGWLLGSILDANAGYYGYGSGFNSSYGYGYPRGVVLPQTQPVVMQATPAAAPAPQQVTIINNYYGNAAPMAQANALFGR